MSKKVKVLAALGAASVALGVVISTAAQGAQTLVVSSDLPLQGGSKDQSESTNNVIKLVLKQAGNKAGKYNLQFKSYDDSTAAKGAWDDAQCAANAQAHVANRNGRYVRKTSGSSNCLLKGTPPFAGVALCTFRMGGPTFSDQLSRVSIANNDFARLSGGINSCNKRHPRKVPQRKAEILEASF